LKESKILLIEDDPDHADLIINALKDEEIDNDDQEVILIKDGKAAIDYFQENDLSEKSDLAGVYSNDEEPVQIELILLDINLPKINGIDVLKCIRMNPKYYSTPVTILSTNSNNDAIEEAYRQGADSFIKKLGSYEKLVEDLKILRNSFSKSYALSYNPDQGPGLPYSLHSEL